MEFGGWNKSGSFGGGYLQQKRHPRNSILSTGFAVVAAFSAALTVPSITQANLTGYKYPVKRVIQTEPQQGWIYTASIPFDATITVAPTQQLNQSYRSLLKSSYRQVEQPSTEWISATQSSFDPSLFPRSLDERVFRKKQRVTNDLPDTAWQFTSIPFVSPINEPIPSRAKKYPLVDQPSDAWIYSNIPVADIWNVSKFQNNQGEYVPKRASLSFRYPLASSGFSTDGSTPQVGDTWSVEKFQNTIWDRTPKRRLRDIRFDFTKQSFALLDSRVVQPAFDQLSGSFRVSKKPYYPVIDPVSVAWIYPNLPAPFDPQYLVHSDDTRMRNRYAKIPYVELPNTAWIYTSLPPAFDPQYFIHSEDTRLRDRYKKVPQLDQPSTSWITLAVPVTGTGILGSSVSGIDGAGTVSGVGTPGQGRKHKIRLVYDPVIHG